MTEPQQSTGLLDFSYEVIAGGQRTVAFSPKAASNLLLKWFSTQLQVATARQRRAYIIALRQTGKELAKRTQRQLRMDCPQKSLGAPRSTGALKRSCRAIPRLDRDKSGLTVSPRMKKQGWILQGRNDTRWKNWLHDSVARVDRDVVEVFNVEFAKAQKLVAQG